MGGLHKVAPRCVSVTESTHTKLKRLARERGVTMSDLVAQMLDIAEREEQRTS